MNHFLNPDLYFECLMQKDCRFYERPDSGVKGVLEDCSTCVFQLKEGKRACGFEFCPGANEKVSTLLTDRVS